MIDKILTLIGDVLGWFFIGICGLVAIYVIVRTVWMLVEPSSCPF